MEKEDFEEQSGHKEFNSEQIAAKWGIDLKDLEAEQEKFSKKIVLKDAIKVEDMKTIAGCDSAYINNQIISAIVVFEDNEVVEEKFAIGKARFPYLPGFLAYREMPFMLECFKKLEHNVDAVLVDGNGILHPRGLGLASHFGLLIEKPTIGIAKNLLIGEIKNKDIYLNKKIVGKVIETKLGSKPLYVSPGNMISVESSAELVKKLIVPPHKLPEPLVLAHKYAKRIANEFKGKKE